MFKAASLIFIALFVQGTVSQAVSEGKCPVVPPVKDFNTAKYMGLWCGYSKDSFPTNANLKCNNNGYTDNGDNNWTLRNRGQRKDNKELFAVNWPARLLSVEESTLAVKYAADVSLDKPTYTITLTDYENYAALYGCDQVNATHKSELIFVITRVPFPSEDIVKVPYDHLASYGVDTSSLVKNDHTDCPPEVYTF